MRKFYNYFFSLFIFCGVSAQTSYSPNGSSGFGGAIGNGSLTLSDNGTALTMEFVRGAGNLNDIAVIYFDTKSGGFADTTSFTDDADGGRSAISTVNGVNSPTVTFPSGFTADYALAFSNNFSALFELTTGSHNFISGANLSPSGDASAALFTMNFDFSNIGVTANQNIDFVITYLSGSAYLSNEVYGSTASIVPDGGGTNPGFTGSITFNAFETYGAVLSTENLISESIEIFASNNKTIHVEGLVRDTTIRAFDLSGKLVLSQQISAFERRIDARQLNDGIYIFQLETDLGRINKKLFLK